MSAIVKVYAALILKGKKTLAEVPESIRQEVAEYIGVSEA